MSDASAKDKRTCPACIKGTLDVRRNSLIDLVDV